MKDMRTKPGGKPLFLNYLFSFLIFCWVLTDSFTSLFSTDSTEVAVQFGLVTSVAERADTFYLSSS
jgi:hypothetical protein